MVTAYPRAQIEAKRRDGHPISGHGCGGGTGQGRRRGRDGWQGSRRLAIAVVYGKGHGGVGSTARWRLWLQLLLLLMLRRLQHLGAWPGLHRGLAVWRLLLERRRHGRQRGGGAGLPERRGTRDGSRWRTRRGRYNDELVGPRRGRTNEPRLLIALIAALRSAVRELAVAQGRQTDRGRGPTRHLVGGIFLVRHCSGDAQRRVAGVAG